MSLRGVLRIVSAAVIVTAGASLLPVPYLGAVPAQASGCGGCTEGGCMCTSGGSGGPVGKECTSPGGLGCDSCCYAPGEYCASGNLNNHRDSTSGCNQT